MTAAIGKIDSAAPLGELQPSPKIKQTATWRAAQVGLLPEKLVFVDATWASTNMAQRYGRDPRGQRIEADATSTLVQNTMKPAGHLSVPPTVEVGTGDNWDAAH